MEVQLQLDGNGRTISVTKQRCSEQSSNGDSEFPLNQDASTASLMDFSSKTIMTSLCAPSSSSSSVDSNEDYDEWRNWMDDILFDCDITDCGLMPRTFWMAANGTNKPRCALEQMALDVFHRHVSSHDVPFDPTTSGAEWWVQIRPSPPTTGRYAMHDDQPDEMSTTGISFHWDKDEDLRLLAGGSLYVHPYLSTVTYLTDFGAPTMAINCRVHCTTGEWIVPQENGNDNGDDSGDGVQAFVSWPKQGKHLSFDGRFLHSAPPDLLQQGVFEQQCKIPAEDHRRASKCNDEESSENVARRLKILQRRHRRVTFLVNVWLNYKPFNVEPFPETMIGKLTKVDDSRWKGVFATDEELEDRGRCVIVQNHEVRDEEVQPGDDRLPQTFTWPTGDCESNERIQMQMPLQSVRREAATGGNVRIRWKDSNGVRLCKEARPAASSGQETVQEDSSVVAESLQPSTKRMKVNHEETDL